MSTTDKVHCVSLPNPNPNPLGLAVGDRVLWQPDAGCGRSKVVGRSGVLTRFCCAGFEDRCYVQFDKRGKAKQRTDQVGIHDLRREEVNFAPPESLPALPPVCRPAPPTAERCEKCGGEFDGKSFVLVWGSGLTACESCMRRETTIRFPGATS